MQLKGTCSSLDTIPKFTLQGSSVPVTLCLLNDLSVIFYNSCFVADANFNMNIV